MKAGVMEPNAIERHYTAHEVAEIWQLSAKVIRSIFQDEPGVLKIGASGRRNKRDYVTIRIPESVMQRVHRERCK